MFGGITGDRELTGSVRSYYEAGFLHSRWNNQLAELPYFSSSDPGFELPSGNRGVPASNYYNPFGEDVEEVRRRVVEVGGRATMRDLNSYRLVVGLTGDMGPDWQWDVNYNISRSVYSDTSKGQFAGSRLELALGPSFDADPGEGVNVVCGTPGPDGQPGTGDDQIIAGCVPLNLFGGPGSITQEMLDYLSVDTNDITRSHTAIWNASVKGDLFEMGGGAAQLALGVETRRERYNYTPDSAVVLRSVTGNSGDGTAGSKAVDSMFAEAYFPIISGAKFADIFDVTVGVRSDEFDSFGNQSSAQMGLRWKPTSDLLLRATWAQSFREPDIGTLYSGQFDSFPVATDPCSIAEWETLDEAARARCISQGVPDGGVNETRAQLRAVVGGNPNLGAESGESFTVGFGWSPSFLDDFSVTVDYWNIELEDAISSYPAEAVLDMCIRDGLEHMCEFITRKPNGTTDKIFTLPENVGAMRASGIDLNLVYGHALMSGKMTHQILLTQLLERETQPYEGSDFVDQKGWFDVIVGGNTDQAAFPETRMIYRNDFVAGRWGISGSVEYISSIKDPLNDLDDDLVYEVGDIVYLDLSAHYSFGTNTTVRFGITNVTDEEAPHVPSGFIAGTDPRTYRMMGTGYFLSLTQRY